MRRSGLSESSVPSNFRRYHFDFELCEWAWMVVVVVPVHGEHVDGSGGVPRVACRDLRVGAFKWRQAAVGA